MRPLTDYDVPALQAELSAAGYNPSHARPILRAFYAAHGCPAFDAARLGRRLCEWLAREFPAATGDVRHRTVSADGTTKLLVGFPEAPGGGAVECVLMPTQRPGRAMACVSSQVGCAMGCDFCASTRRGLERNLTAAEITAQFLRLRAEAAALGRKVTSLVFMGMGEPMHNLGPVLAAIRSIAHPDLGGLGWRQVTVSTVGVVPGIDRLAGEGLNVHLAVSLHAPDDATRSRLVPMNRRYDVADVVAAAKRFHEKTGRIVTIEYCLLDGVNDSGAHAAALAALLQGFRVHVNLIPYNAIGAGLSGVSYRRPPRDRVTGFLDVLRRAGTVAHVRETRGDDVNAACGQLRETLSRAAGPTGPNP